MTVPIRFGYKASSEQFGPRELLDYAVLAEEVGFDSVFLSDHLQPWMHEGGHAPAALPWLGSAGERTSRVLLGTSVLTPTFRYHPGVIAQAFGTLGAMYPGRMILGVGTGEALNEVTLGLDWPEPPERFQRMKEAITLIRKLWESDRVTFDGTYYSVNNATIYDRPSQPVPIYIGASGARRHPSGRSDGRRLDHHERQGERTVHRYAHPRLRGRTRQGLPDPRRRGHPDGGEGIVPAPTARRRSRTRGSGRRSR